MIDSGKTVTYNPETTIIPTSTSFNPPKTFCILTPWETLTPWSIAAKYKNTKPTLLVLKSDGSIPHACITYSPKPTH